MKSNTFETKELSKDILQNKKVQFLFLYFAGVFINVIPILLSLSCSGDGCMFFYVSKISLLYWALSYLFYLLIPKLNYNKKEIISIIPFLPLFLFVLLAIIWWGGQSLFLILLFGTHNLIYAFIARHTINRIKGKK